MQSPVHSILVSRRSFLKSSAVLAGSAPGRESNDEITVFESLGLAVEDLASAEYLLRRAAETGTGTTVEF